MLVIAQRALGFLTETTNVLAGPWSVNSLCFSISQVYHRTLGYVLLMIANKLETRVQHYLQTAFLIFITISLLSCRYVPS